jgi:UDP-N-acetylglucosamine acyltransferase
MIHPTAIVHPQARVHDSASIGPYSIIDEHVVIGPDCRIGPNVYLTGWTELGARNTVHFGCVLGDAPQDFKYRGQPTKLRIGDDNVFREHVTVHRSNSETEGTVIGSKNFFMASSHVGHNSVLGDNVILANAALIGGHVYVGDRAFVSGSCLVHQFARIGTLALMQGGSGISKDLPPFTIARGNNGICGLNVIGLRRAGFSPDDRKLLKRLYKILFRSGVRLSAALEEARSECNGNAAGRVLLDFVAASKRGLCADVSQKNSARNVTSDADETSD